MRVGDGDAVTRPAQHRHVVGHVAEGDRIVAGQVALGADGGQRRRLADAGCADFDTKPVDLARLVGKIRACLMRKKSRRDESRESAGF